jgi:hypothetical protein
MSGQWEKEKGIILTTMKYIYKFPEKHQFGVKAGYYGIVKDDFDKVFQKLGHIFDSKFELHQHQSKPIILPLP